MTIIGDGRIKGHLTFEQKAERDAEIKRLYSVEDLSMPRIAAQFGLHDRSVWRIIHDDRKQHHYGGSSGHYIDRPLDEDGCGTEAGEKAHRRRNQKPCKACLDAAAQARATRHMRRKNRYGYR